MPHKIIDVVRLVELRIPRPIEDGRVRVMRFGRRIPNQRRDETRIESARKKTSDLDLRSDMHLHRIAKNRFQLRRRLVIAELRTRRRAQTRQVPKSIEMQPEVTAQFDAEERQWWHQR